MLADVLDETAVALRAGAWPHALPLALAAWRETRSAELANLIDRVEARCTLPKPPHTQAAIHRWWMQHAIDPDPLMIGALLAAFPVRRYVDDEVSWAAMRARWTEPNPIIEAIDAEPAPPWWGNYRPPGEEALPWPPRVQNWVDRLAAMIRWPHDPRLTRVLVELLGDPNCSLPGEANHRVYRAITDRLIAQRDARAGARLPALVSRETYPPLKQRVTNPLIAELTTALVEPSPIEPARIAACVAVLPAEDHREVGFDHLWRQVAEHPDDEAARLVLADALIGAGDSRGELIALQCVTDPAKAGNATTRAHRLIRQDWSRWMGDLVHVLARHGTEMSRGMLDKIRVGKTSTPAWAWDAVVGHRELATVREVRPAHVAPATFARFVTRLERCPRMLGLDAPEVLEELVKTWTNRPVEEVYYSAISALAGYRRARPSWETVVAMLEQVAPDLQRLDLGRWWVSGAGAQALEPHRLVAMLEGLPLTFRKLRRLRIDPASMTDHAKLLVGALPFVELVAPPALP